MSEIRTYGLKSVLVGVPTETGAMPAVLTELCRTYRNSFEFLEDTPELKEEFCDQDDDPVEVFSGRASKTVRFSTFDYSPETLVKLKGGEVVDEKWAEPTGTPAIYVALRAVTDTGLEFDFPKVRLMASFNAKIVKDSLALIEVLIKPVSPGKGKSGLQIGKETP